MKPDASKLHIDYSSALDSGLSPFASPSDTTQQCLMPPAVPVHYQPCDIASLIIMLEQDKFTHSMSIDGKRIGEPIGPSVNDDYRGDLGSHDLVIEALAPLKDDKTTYSYKSKSTDSSFNVNSPLLEYQPVARDNTRVATPHVYDLQRYFDSSLPQSLDPAHQQSIPRAEPLQSPAPSQGGIQSKTETSTDKPLQVAGLADAFAQCEPKHPETTLTGGGLTAPDEPDATTAAKISARPAGLFGDSIFGQIWPFGDDRIDEYVLKSETCGQRPQGTPIRSLSAKIIVMPLDCWRVTIGLDAVKSGSYQKSKSYNNKTGPNDEDTGIQVITKTRSRGLNTEHKTTRIADTDFAESYSVSADSHGLLGGSTQTLSESESTWEPEEFEDETQRSMRKVKIERVIGSQTMATEIDKPINKILEIIDTAKKLTDVLDSVPDIGWSIDTSFEFLSGEIIFEWGHRWPQNYVEQDRVYSVERYLSVGGNVTLAKGSFEAKFGIEIDPWWLSFYFVAKIYVLVKADISVKGSGGIEYTNSIMQPSLDTLKVEPSGTVSFEAGAKIGGKAFGHSITGRLGPEGKLEFKSVAEFSFSRPPTMKGDLESGGIYIVGKVEISGSSRDYEFEPLKIVEKKTYFKDKVFF